MTPFLAHRFYSPIWRMEIDDITSTLFIELRNEPEKQVSFASLSLRNGKLNFEDLRTEERWLTGIECAYNGVAMLHFYKHQNGPEHKGIIAVDALTGEQLWARYSHAFDHLTINGPAIYDTAIRPKKVQLANIKTGAILKDVSADDKPFGAAVVLPTLMPADVLSGVSLPNQPYGNIVHYHCHNNLICLSLHAFENGELQQHLYVISGNDVVYSDVLNTGIQKLQPEAFVLHKNALVYIKNKNELKAISL